MHFRINRPNKNLQIEKILNEKKTTGKVVAQDSGVICIIYKPMANEVWICPGCFTMFKHVALDNNSHIARTVFDSVFPICC